MQRTSGTAGLREPEYNERVEGAIEPQPLADALANAAVDMKAADVILLDLRGRVDYTDIFVLCTGRNPRHVNAIADELRRVAKRELSIPCAGVEGLPAARWVLVDFESVVVHIFDQPMRGFYDLDGFWGDVPRLPPPEGAEEVTADEVDDWGFPESFGA